MFEHIVNFMFCLGKYLLSVQILRFRQQHFYEPIEIGIAGIMAICILKMLFAFLLAHGSFFCIKRLKT